MKIAGKQTHTQNSEELRYSPTEGWSGTWGISGPKEAVRAQLNSLAALGYSINFRTDQNPLAEIQYSTPGTVTPGGPEVPTLQWEFFANVAEIDVLETDIALVAGLTKNEITGIRSGLASPDPADQPALTGNAESIYVLMQAGVRSFRVNLPTLRVSKLVSGSYPVKASMTNVGRIISTGTLGVQESIPNTILFELPDYSSDKTGFSYAWYKSHPSVQQAGGNRWNVSQQWEYGLWPTILYGSVL